ncbi:MAG: NYN domain-containing protein [Deltaproteobacteria bacterium]|nr:NYN domain-containing protein [Deltaproteobacteria bacterium]MBW2394597.1 NYN domain-containing protein [Deltaproteobacteria bacterium]
MEEPEHWLVDGFNVLHVALLHGRERGRWWRAEARDQLLSRIQRFEGPGKVCVVFDGPRPETDPEPPATGVSPELPPAAAHRIVFAPSADDWLLAEIRKHANPIRLAIVTADRRLADRARHRGAQIQSPRDFLARCPADDPPPSTGS